MSGNWDELEQDIIEELDCSKWIDPKTGKTIAFMFEDEHTLVMYEKELAELMKIVRMKKPYLKI